MRPTIWLQIRCMIISHYLDFGSLFSGSRLGFGRRSFYCSILELAKIYGVRGQYLWDFGNNAFFNNISFYSYLYSFFHSNYVHHRGRTIYQRNEHLY